MAKATIYDVAREAGVSIASVSRVLNNPDQVKPATRARVLAAIDKLKFIPRQDAVARARRGTGRIGIVTPSLTDDSFVDRLRGMFEALTGMTYEAVIYLVTSSAQRDGILTQLALMQPVDGIIVIGVAMNDEIIERFIANNVPVVLFTDARSTLTYPIHQICVDHGAGAQMAADYLLERGHRRLAYMGDMIPPDYSESLGRLMLDVFRQRLAEQGVSLPDAYVALAPQNMEEARQQAHRLLDLPVPPTAIFASSDTQAIGVISAARERGLSIPEDLAVLGFDDITIAEFINLTTIRQELKESGRTAVRMVTAAIESKDRQPEIVQMPLTLVVRNTV